MTLRRTTETSMQPMLVEWRGQILSRRAFLARLAGGSLAALMPVTSLAAGSNPEELTEHERWVLLDTVQNHLFPGEPGVPGAREIKALVYLRFVVNDKQLDTEEREFILHGVSWLEDLTRKDLDESFLKLDAAKREQMLRKVASSSAGENWLSTIQLYICEALLTDPVYGGNPGGIGWKWLGHNPGFPRPKPGKRYGLT